MSEEESNAVVNYSYLLWITIELIFYPFLGEWLLQLDPEPTSLQYIILVVASVF